MKSGEIWTSNETFLWELSLLRSRGSVKHLLYRSAAPGFTFSRQNPLVLTVAVEGRVSGSVSSEKSTSLKREKESKGCSVSRNLCSADEGANVLQALPEQSKGELPFKKPGPPSPPAFLSFQSHSARRIMPAFVNIAPHTESLPTYEVVID